MPTPLEGLAALQAAAETGELDEFCARHRVRVLTVFGSAARGEPNARDLDIGVLFEPGSIGLFESEPGALAQAQVAAVMERIDTRWMRQLDLELMAG